MTTSIFKSRDSWPGRGAQYTSFPHTRGPAYGGRGSFNTRGRDDARGGRGRGGARGDRGRWAGRGAVHGAEANLTHHGARVREVEEAPVREQENPNAAQQGEEAPIGEEEEYHDAAREGEYAEEEPVEDEPGAPQPML
ncbi:unnamed protein product [Penicillium discolor]